MNKRILVIVELFVLGLLLFWHWKLGLVRFFDADEFAHLHWGYSFSIGERPYTDFFYLFPPFFLYPLAAIFKIFGRTVEALFAGRMFIFFVFLATTGVLFLIAKRLRNLHFALLTVIIFAFLPLPFDKFIEVRPDIVATMLALGGLLLFIAAEPYKTDKANKTNRINRWYFFSGLSYAASLAVVPKTVFFLVPVGVVFAYRWLRGDKGDGGDEGNRGREKKDGFYFFLGMVPVGLVLFLILSSFGNLEFSIYSMTRMASEVTKVLGSKFYMRPDIFFYPNDLFYGIAGWSIPLWVNLMIYVTASVWAIHRLLGFNLGGDGPAVAKAMAGKREFLVAGSFWANLTAFVFFYPLKHSQYLIPVAPFVAFYAADLTIRLISQIRLIWIRSAILMIVLAGIVIVSSQMNQKKMQWGNGVTMDKVNNFLKTIPPESAVYDLTGESVFFKNGYYFCCLPYGQYEEALYFRIPDIEKDLARRGTKYVHLGWQRRLDEIPGQHARYIRENFEPVAGDGLLLKKYK